MAVIGRFAVARAAALLCASFLVCQSGPASADDACNKPLHLLTSLPMTPANGDLVTVPISFNGVQKQFLLDTGGLVMQLSSTVADTLKLTQRQSPIELYSVNGDVSRKYVTVQNFAMGSLHAPRLEMQISPHDVDGLFAPLGWSDFDFDMDFASQKLNIISNDHCDGKVVYWHAQAIAVVPVTLSDSHITVPVSVDDHKLRAIIDTGATTSTMRLDIARRVFGLAADSPDMKAVGHLTGDDKATIYAHPFKTLAFEGVTVNNPQIAILTDVVNKNADHGFQTGSNVKRDSDDLTLPEVIVGMDVLRKLHLYLAIKEKRLYLTEASVPAPSSSPAP